MTSFHLSEVEEEVVRDLCGRLWSSEDADLGLGSPLGQAALLRLLTPLHLDRLPRTLARALLYSGGQEDTRVVTSTTRSDLNVRHKCVVSQTN